MAKTKRGVDLDRVAGALKEAIRVEAYEIFVGDVTGDFEQFAEACATRIASTAGHLPRHIRKDTEKTVGRLLDILDEEAGKFRVFSRHERWIAFRYAMRMVCRVLLAATEKVPAETEEIGAA